MTRTAHYVSSTHWDREWYESFQGFRMRLVTLLDEVIETLERDPAFASFVLDGQVIPLHDYLEVRPERADRVGDEQERGNDLNAGDEEAGDRRQPQSAERTKAVLPRSVLKGQQGRAAHRKSRREDVHGEQDPSPGKGEDRGRAPRPPLREKPRSQDDERHRGKARKKVGIHDL